MMMEEGEEERQEETKNSIPQEIIFEILKELPAKSLLRFRCVSKLWCSIIDDPLFITSHRARSHTRHGGITILMLAKPVSYRYSPDQHLTHFFSINPQGIEPPRPLQTLPCIHDFSRVQFVNGLVCFNNNVWNPSTREIITLPPTPITCELLSNHTQWIFSRHCFLGFAPNTNEYKVLQLCQTYATKGHEIKNLTWGAQCRILTLGLGTNTLWRNFDFDFDFDDCLPIQLGNFHIMNVCCFNGTMYFLGENDHHVKILAFDVEHEKFRCISLPDDTSFQVTLIQVGECLALIDKNVDKLWMLDESFGGNWKRESLIIPEIYKSNSPWQMLTPIGSIHNGDEILLHRWKVEEGEDEILLDPWGEEVGRKKFLELFYYEVTSKSFRRICSISRLPGLPDSVVIEPFQISFRKQVECLFRLKGCNVSSQKNK